MSKQNYQMQDTTFKSGDHMLAGNLYLPENFNEEDQYPAVIFSGPFNQVKEQTGAVYAKHFAEQGYITLVFDHAGYGDSEGTIRNFEQPFIKMEGIRDGISYLGTLPYIDAEKLYGLGVYASGGYMPIVATTDKRLKAVATVSGMMDNEGGVFDVMSKEEVLPILIEANKARQKQYETGEVEYNDGLGYSLMTEEQIDALDKTSARYEGYDFYMTERAGSQTYPNYTYNVPSNLMEYTPLTSALKIAGHLYTPYLGVIGELATDTGPLTEKFFEATTEPKKLLVVPNATHVSLYDNDEHVQQAVGEMIDFFGEY